MGADVGAEVAPHELVAALADQVEVEFAQRRPEPVRVVDGEGGAAGVADLELVPAGGENLDGLVDGGAEHAGGVRGGHLDPPPVGEHDGHGFGAGAVAPHHGRVAVGVDPEDVVGVGVLAGHDLLHLDGDGIDLDRRSLGSGPAVAGRRRGVVRSGAHHAVLAAAPVSRPTASKGMRAQSGRLARS